MNTIVDNHYLDENENPEGGTTYGHGFTIAWQRGPLAGNSRNGAFVEDVILAAIRRIEFYQDSKFKCEENQRALEHLYAAKVALQERTNRRITQGVEGTHQGN